MLFYTDFRPATPLFWNPSHRFDFFYPRQVGLAFTRPPLVHEFMVSDNEVAEEEISRMDAIEARLDIIENDIYDEDDEEELDEEDAKEEE